MRKAAWVSGLVGLAVVVGLAVAAHWARQDAEPGCTLDGVKIESLYRVEVVDAAGQAHAFCCPICARIWLGRQATLPRAVRVTDEASGELIDAATAHYVHSSVVTVPVTRNRVHAFRSRADADGHAKAFAGFVLLESEGPFRR